MSDTQYRLRIRYAKAGRLKFLSHLELIRALERVVRRAGLPSAVTQGFNPHMKVAFGPALPVGTAGEDEYLDVWLTEYVRPQEALERLRSASPDDIAPIEVGYVPASQPSLAAALTMATYVLTFSEAPGLRDALESGIGRTMAQGSVRVDQKGKEKVYDLSRVFWKEPRVTGRDGRIGLELSIRTSNEGSLRPESYLSRVLEDWDGTAVPQTVRTSQSIEEKDGALRRPL